MRGLKEFKVRLARVEDLAAVIALERGVAEAPHWPVEEYGAMVPDDREGWVRRCLFVAEGGGGLVGFAVGKTIAMVAEAELESVIVAAAARRAGVGRALCEAVVAWCREAGATTVELEVREGNSGARALYRGLGFVEVGIRPRYYREPVEDAILMRAGTASF